MRTLESLVPDEPLRAAFLAAYTHREHHISTALALTPSIHTPSPRESRCGEARESKPTLAFASCGLATSVGS